MLGLIKDLVCLLWQLILEIVYPPVCCGCHKIGHHLCPNCYGLIQFNLTPLNLPIEENYLDEIHAVAGYYFPLNNLIKLLKYKHVKEIGEILGRMIYDTSDVPPSDIITSVPLHPTRQRQRGFNQAEVIARELATQSGIPYSPLLIRKFHTKNQAMMKTKTDRLKNLQNIFSPSLNFKNNKPPPTVLIIDDVITTGSTLNECAKVLKQNGVQKVIALCVAHGQ